MQDIAAAAGVSMGLLYRYFASKDAIIETVAAIDRAETLAKIAAIARAQDVPKALEAHARAQIAGGGEPGYVALITEIAAEACRNPAIRGLVERDDREICQALIAVLRGHRKAGRLAAGADIEAFVQVCMAQIDGLILRAHLGPALDIDACLAAFKPALEALRR